MAIIVVVWCPVVWDSNSPKNPNHTDIFRGSQISKRPGPKPPIFALVEMLKPGVCMASPLKGGCHHRGRDAICDGFWYRCLCGFLEIREKTGDNGWYHWKLELMGSISGVCYIAVFFFPITPLMNGMMFVSGLC